MTGEIEGYFLLDETKAAPEDMDEDEFDVLPPTSHRPGTAHHRGAAAGVPSDPVVRRGVQGPLPPVRREPERGPLRLRARRRRR